MSRQAVQSYRDLIAWQEAVSLVVACYELTAMFPKQEVYGLTSQMRRAAVSIPANIAEGYAWDSAASYAQFLKIARGSLRELETLLIVSEKVRISNDGSIQPALDQCDRVGRLLHGLLRSVQGSGVHD